jgi:hypothetical protein
VIRTSLRCEAIRICGSGKLRAAPQLDVSSVYLLPLKFAGSGVCGHFKGLPTSLFSVLPDRFALRNVIAFD